MGVFPLLTAKKSVIKFKEIKNYKSLISKENGFFSLLSLEKFL